MARTWPPPCRRSGRSATTPRSRRRSTRRSPAASSRSASKPGGSRSGLRQPGLLRPLETAELSDGTLRYLLWVAALLTPRPPALLVINEPETSLHPDLLRPLSGLTLAGSARTQIVVVSHSRALVHALDQEVADLTTIELVKDLGETRVAGRDRLDQPAWKWPKR